MGRLALSPLELASGHIPGEDSEVPPLPKPDPSMSPLEALERATLPALERSPCVVSFSGGRDSSVVLAAAARAARREGLPLPVPVTLVSPGFPEADETMWQEIVIRHLRLPEWQRVEVIEERDLLGPVAREVLRRHGVIYPFGGFTDVPILEHAVGGSVLTGEDGDGLFASWDSARVLAVLTGRARPARRDLLRLAKAALPRIERAWVQQRFRPLRLPWLLPDAQAAVVRAWADELGSEPRRWDRWVEWWSRRRYLTRLRQGIDLVGAVWNARSMHPLLDPCFLAIVARRGGRIGFGDRTRAMRALFPGLLPDAVLGRADKADFSRLAWGPHARAFVEAWPGDRIPAELVDIGGLRRVWGDPVPVIRTAYLLQAAWLSGSVADRF